MSSTVERYGRNLPGCHGAVSGPARLGLLSRLCFCAMALSFPWLALAADTNGNPELPASSLKPPRGEIPPSFWELYGPWIILAAVIFVALVALALWLITRPRTPPPVPCSTLARQEFESLRPQPEDGPLLSRTSQILRRCLAAMFELPSGELTTTEFCQAALASNRLGPELAKDSAEFLKACDLNKFAPSHPEVPVGVVNRALGLIDRAERRLADLDRLQASPANSSGPPPVPAMSGKNALQAPDNAGQVQHPT